MARPIRAELSSSALRHNYALAKSLAKEAQAFAVVKANAYGHGLAFAYKALKHADGFATLELESALQLRQLGAAGPLLMLEGFFEESELSQFAAHRLTTVLHSTHQVGQLMQADLSRPIDTFIKINTGMNRLGLTEHSIRYALSMAATHKNFGAVTLMTHFATADDERGVGAQLRAFRPAEATAKELMGRKPFQTSVANSAALLRYPNTHRDWVRPGIMLYGSSPFADKTAAELGLKPVMSLRSEIIGVQNLERGESVGYAATYTAAKKMRIGIVACGYADGYPRHAPGGNEFGAPIVVSGKRSRIVGRVSMDMMAVDITDIPSAKIGTPVTLWGEGLPADEVAAAAGTIAYELFCGITNRVPMVEVA